MAGRLAPVSLLLLASLPCLSYDALFCSVLFCWLGPAMTFPQMLLQLLLQLLLLLPCKCSRLAFESPVVLLLGQAAGLYNGL